MLVHIAVHDIAVCALEFEKRQERVAHSVRRIHFQTHLDEGVEIPNPDFPVTAAGVEPGAQELPGHAVDLHQGSVGPNFAGELGREDVVPV